MNDRRLTAALAVAAVMTVVAAASAVSSRVIAHRVHSNAASVTDLRREHDQAVHANLAARYDDCVAQNATRKALREIAEQNRRSLPVTRKLFPNIPARLFERAERQFRFQMRAFRAKDCRRYALRAKPQQP